MSENVGIYEVWAVCNYGDPEVRRWFGGKDAAIREAEWVARQSDENGAVSVYVKGAEGIVWAAGVKAQELTAGGHVIEYGGLLLVPA